jgi:hypothetical protein
LELLEKEVLIGKKDAGDNCHWLLDDCSVFWFEIVL